MQSESTATNQQARDTAEIPALLDQPPLSQQNEDFATEQWKDPELVEMITHLEHCELPPDNQRVHRITFQKLLFTIEGGILVLNDPKQKHRKRVVVPSHLRGQLLSEHHSSPMGGRCTAKKTYGALMRLVVGWDVQ